MVPSINAGIQQGMDLTANITEIGKPLNLTQVNMKTSLDYVGLGLLFDI